MSKRLVIFGAGEMATLARYYFEQDARRGVDAFVVDDDYAKEDRIEGLPVVPWSEATGRFGAADYEMFVALGFAGLNAVRKKKFEECKAAGYELATYVSSKAVTWPDLKVGANTLILENVSVNPTVRIGDNVIVWTSNSLGHGSVIEDHVYIASMVCVAGNCRLGERSFFGVQTAIRDHCTVGAESFVGMGACVTRDLPARSVVLGPKSDIADATTAEFVRRRYFPGA